MKPEAIAKLLTPFKNRLVNLITRAQVISVDTSVNPYVVNASVRGRTTPQKINFFQQYGVATVPPADADLVRVHLTADPDNPLVLASHHNSQPTGLSSGDVALYDNRSQFVRLLQAGIDLISPNKIDLNAPSVNLGLGGPAIARVGDTVTVTVVGGSSGGTHFGTITSGGLNTSL